MDYPALAIEILVTLDFNLSALDLATTAKFSPYTQIQILKALSCSKFSFLRSS